MISKEILRNVIASQREFLDNSEQGTLREKNKEIEIVDSFALIITGVRRSGKSTIMYQMINKLLQRGISQKQILFVNLEDKILDKSARRITDKLLIRIKKTLQGIKKL